MKKEATMKEMMIWVATKPCYNKKGGTENGDHFRYFLIQINNNE